MSTEKLTSLCLYLFSLLSKKTSMYILFLHFIGMLQYSSLTPSLLSACNVNKTPKVNVRQGHLTQHSVHFYQRLTFCSIIVTTSGRPPTTLPRSEDRRQHERYSGEENHLVYIVRWCNTSPVTVLLRFTCSEDGGGGGGMWSSLWSHHFKTHNLHTKQKKTEAPLKMFWMLKEPLAASLKTSSWPD